MFGFPNPVNEKAARVVAGVVAVTGVVILLDRARTGCSSPLAYGFWARVLTGPTLSPLGRVAMRVVAPRLGPPKYVAGPPKRFAQGMGAAFTTVAAVLALGFGPTRPPTSSPGCWSSPRRSSRCSRCASGCQDLRACSCAPASCPEETCERCANIWAQPPATQS